MSLSTLVSKLKRIVRGVGRASWAEISDLVVAQWHLLVARITLLFRPRGELVRQIDSDSAEGGSTDEERLERISVAVDRMSRLGLFRPTCLVRAMALERMIRRARAGRARVRVGVIKKDADFAAHAWIELDGRVIGDDPRIVQGFTPLMDVTTIAT